jgi:putative ABC transport system permease protein
VTAFVDNVLFEALPYALVALGVVLTFRYLRLIDLTFAASFVLGPAVAGALMVNGVAFPLAILVGLVLVAVLAVVTIGLMWLLELDGLLASLLTSFAGFSVALLFTQGTLSLHGVYTPVDALKAFDFPWVVGNIPLHPAQIMLFALLLIVAKVAVDRFLGSELGLAFRAMEDERSRESLLASIGISHWRMLAGGVLFGNILCTIAGVLVMLKEGQVTATRGFDVFLAVIAAYLFGTVLFERRPVRTDNGGRLGQLLRAIAVFQPTTAAVLGLLFYFALLAGVSRLDVPASVPKLVMIGLVIASFLITRWSDITCRISLSRVNRTKTVAPDAPFEATDVSIDYPGFPKPASVIRNAHLRLGPSTATQIRGPNGSGKSTLLRFLSGRLDGRGHVSVPRVINAQSVNREEMVGYISQDSQLGSTATLSVPENLALFNTNHAKSPWRRWKQPPASKLPKPVRSLVEAANGIPARFLSSGQRQVLGIAAMIVREDAPLVVLFDEPLTHLDEPNAIACVELMERLLAEGRTLLIVQHDIESGAIYSNSPARTRLAKLMNNAIELIAIQQSDRQCVS